MKITSRLTGIVLAGLFLALHLPFLPASLEDLDSVNFALGIRDYDVSRHQPHPPGYPLFIGPAKLLHAIGLSEVHALSLIGVVAGALAIVALMSLFDHLSDDRANGPLTWVAVATVAANPLYWLTAARPLSDVMGLAAALGVQVLILSADSVGTLAIAAALASCAAGIRSQVVWLTLPLLILAVCRLPFVARMRGAVWAAGAYGVGALTWAVPLVLVSGGPGAYWRALSNQGAEDLSGVTMLATTPTVRQLAKSLQYALIEPWGYWQVGAVVVLLAAIGLVRMTRRARPALLSLAVAFGPYLVFDLLFQETITTRYALPLVIPAGYLAVRGLSFIPEAPAVALALGLVVCSAVVDDAVLSAYSRSQAPVFRMLGDWTAAADAQGPSFRAPEVAMHRREEFDLRRPLLWNMATLPTVSRLPATAKHEWLEVVKYWNRGGTDPVWFVADPLRSDLALIRSPNRPSRYRWPFTPTNLLGGARPGELDWHLLDAPDWYLGEGWSLTPETAGVAKEDGKGPGYGSISGWVRRSPLLLTLMIGGRNLTVPGAPAQVRVAIDGMRVSDVTVPPGFFLQTIEAVATPGVGAYATLTLDSDRTDLAVEQFDAQPTGHVMFGFGDGWHEQEYNPSTGRSWRWTSERAQLRVRAEGHALALTLRGEIEAASTSHVVVRAGGRVVDEFEAGPTFGRTVIIPAGAVSGPESVLTIESSASYVPAETRWRSRDRRRLGLKLTECRVTQAS